MHTKTAKKHISLIIPLYNEEYNIVPLFESIERAFSGLRDTYLHEIIFVNDGSRDTSGEVLESLCRAHRHVQMIELSRNFGKEMALSAGIHVATGDAVITLDADGQHPPDRIPEFLERWRMGADIVIGVRRYLRPQDTFRRFGSYMFYRIMNHIAEIPIVPRSTDFRLIDARVVVEFNRFTERNRLARGLLDWLGFRRDYVEFFAPDREHGAPAYSRIQLVRLAIRSFISHSFFPLKFSGYLGTGITLSSGTLGAYIILTQYILPSGRYDLAFSGTAMLAIFNTFLIGIVLMSFGLTATATGSLPVP